MVKLTQTPKKLDAIERIDFSVNGNIACVIDDLSGIKMFGYGEAVHKRDLETSLVIPNYIDYIYYRAFICGNNPTPVIHGTKGSYAEQFVRDYLTDYNYLTYNGDTFTAEVRENYIPHSAILTGTSFSCLSRIVFG
jgi:hypothetical protein